MKKISVDVAGAINQCSLRRSTSKTRRIFEQPVVQVILFCFFIFLIHLAIRSNLYHKKELKGKTKSAIISHPGGKDCKAGHGKCSFFVLKSPHWEYTPFQAAQKEHCPYHNHATHLCRDHGL